MAYVRVEQIRKMSELILCAVGVPKEQASIIADTVVYAHTHLRATHGITRFPIYIRKIRQKLMSADTKLEVVCDLQALAVMDAHNGFGQIAAWEGIHRCIEKARICGIGGVGIRNSNNFGVTAFFGELAAKEHLVGIIVGAASPAIAPTGGSRPIFGTNPICIALPNREGKMPIVLDMATSEAARGKIRLAAKNGENIPFGWAIDENGRPTDDPFAALRGTMLPIGGYKGYGLSLMIDVLGGLLTGNPFGGEIKPLNEPHDFSQHGHAMMAINIESIMPYSEYLSKIDLLIERIRECGEPGSVLLPGEKEFEAYMQNSDIVDITDKQIEEFNELAHSLKINESL